jgi:hypothetical protein
VVRVERGGERMVDARERDEADQRRVFLVEQADKLVLVVPPEAVLHERVAQRPVEVERAAFDDPDRDVNDYGRQTRVLAPADDRVRAGGIKANGTARAAA